MCKIAKPWKMIKIAQRKKNTYGSILRHSVLEELLTMGLGPFGGGGRPGTGFAVQEVGLADLGHA